MTQPPSTTHPTERWEQIAALPEGQLAEVSYASLLMALSRAGRSGVLELHRKPVEKRIFFVDGVPVDCRSNLVHETFGRYLVGAGKLREEDFRPALAEALSRQVKLGEVLVERNLIDSTELFRQLQQCLARKLLDGFTWRTGTFRLLPEEGEVDTSLKVRVPQLVLTGVLKFTHLEEVTRGIRPFFAEPVACHPAPAISEEDVQLRGPAADVLAALAAKPLRMDELAARLPQLPPNDLGRVLYALALLELVVQQSKLPRAASPPRRPSPPAPAPVAAAVVTSTAAEDLATRRIELEPTLAASVPASELEQVKNRVVQAYGSYRRKDAFDLFGLRDEATPEQIDAAWLDCASSWAPWSLARVASPDLVEKAAALFLAGSQAYAELRDGERRAMLVHRRQQAREERARAARAAPRIQTALLDPEAQFQKGMELLRAGQERKALELLQYAADLDAQNAVYRAEAAWCRHRVLGEAQKALEELDEAVRADPRCGLAWFYMGQVQGREGSLAAAEESLRKAIKLMAPDRRPIEALKELTSRKR